MALFMLCLFQFNEKENGKTICTDCRTCLTAEHVDMRTCLNRWINQKLDDDDQKAATTSQKRQKRSLRFATLSAKMELQVEEPSVDEEEDEESDDE